MSHPQGSPNPMPEAQARVTIDAMLKAAGWVIQDYRAMNLDAAAGIALREVPLDSGHCDYLLLVNRVPVGVVEAKKEGTMLSAVADQSAHYAENIPDAPAFLAKCPLSARRQRQPPGPRHHRAGNRRRSGGRLGAVLSHRGRPEGVAHYA